MAPRSNVWRRLWQYLKRTLRTLLNLTQTPRRMFSYIYANLFKPVWGAATTVMKPLYNYFVALATTILPAAVNPFHDYVFDNEKQDIYTRFAHGGQHLIWSWKSYIYTTRPNTVRKTFQEQLTMDPMYYDEMDQMDRNGILPQIQAEEEWKRVSREKVYEHFKEIAGVLPEQIPLGRDEMHRQAIGAQTTLGWWVGKFFFWWSDLLLALEGIVAYPLELAVRFMRRFGFQRESALVYNFEQSTGKSIMTHREQARFNDPEVFKRAWRMAMKKLHRPMVPENDVELELDALRDEEKEKEKNSPQKIKADYIADMKRRELKRYLKHGWEIRHNITWKDRGTTLTPRQRQLLDTIDPEKADYNEAMLVAELAKEQFQADERERVRWGWTALAVVQDTWGVIKQSPLLFMKAADAFGTAIMTPFAFLFAFVDAAIGDPIRIFAHFLTNNWFKYVWLPFREDVFEPILYKKLWKPVLSQPWEDLVDPLIGHWIRTGIRLLFHMTNQLARDPLVFLFSAMNRIMKLPGDLLYLVYLFIMELEATLYFYFLYPLTIPAIQNDSFGKHIWTRLHNLWRTFIHIVGYTKPTAVMGMSIVFTSILVFFLNLVPF